MQHRDDHPLTLDKALPDVPRATATLLEDAHTAAGAVYFKGQPPGSKELPGGWTRLPIPPGHPGLAAAMKTADCEYVRSPSGKDFVAFRGTAQGSDWVANLANGVSSSYLPVPSAKHDAAAEIGRDFRDVRPEVTFTGHSLGGGLAKLAGEAASHGAAQGETSSKTVVAFNAASVAPGTYVRHGLPPENHERTTIHVVNENDILNRALKGGKTSFLGGAPIAGREHVERDSMIVLAKGSGSVIGASGHGIGNFVPQGEPANAQHFTAPLFKSHGEPVEAGYYDRFKPLPPVPGHTAAVLQQAAPSQTQARQQGLGH